MWGEATRGVPKHRLKTGGGGGGGGLNLIYGQSQPKLILRHKGVESSGGCSVYTLLLIQVVN